MELSGNLDGIYCGAYSHVIYGIFCWNIGHFFTIDLGKFHHDQSLFRALEPIGTIVHKGNHPLLWAELFRLPSGELTFCHGKSPFLIGKPSINGSFSIAMLVHQRVFRSVEI